MSKSLPAMEPRKRDQILAGARLALSTMVTVVDGLNVPFLKAAPQTVQHLIMLAEAVKSNKADCARLAKHCAELVAALSQALKGRTWESIDENLKQSIVNFSGTLGSIEAFMEKVAERKYFSRLISYADDAGTIKNFQDELQRALDVFGVKTIVGINLVQKDIQVMVEEIKQTMNAMALQPSIQFQVGLPTRPSIFHGRDQYVADAVNLIFSNQPARLAILGPGGIGKTSVAAAIIDHQRVKDDFSGRRYFVRCEATTTAELFISALITTFGIQVSGGHGHTSDLLAPFVLTNEPKLVVLDNFETPWQADEHRSAIQTVLNLLVSGTNVTLLVTMRGTVRPSVVKWTQPYLDKLQVLDADAAEQTYQDISPTQDPNLRSLLSSLNYVPLAITLMANVGQMGPFEPTFLLERWILEKTKMLTTEGDSKDTNLDVSISISIQSPLMRKHPAALHLLRIVAYLPSGLAMKYVKEMTDKVAEWNNEWMVLLQAGLAHQSRAQVCTVLSPIRSFLQLYHPLSELEAVQIQLFYKKLAAKGKQVDGNHNKSDAIRVIVNQLASEKENVIHVLQQELAQSNADEDLIWSIIHFSKFLYHTVPSMNLLAQVQGLVEKSDKKDIQAAFYQRCGEILRMLDEYDQAKIMLIKSKNLFEVLGDKLEVGQCLLVLGDIAKTLNEYEQANIILTEAQAQFQSIGYQLGVAWSLQGLGETGRMLSNYTQAKAMLIDAKDQFTNMGNKLGIALCLQSLGNMARMLSEYKQAKAMLTEANGEFQAAGDQYQAAECLWRLGEIESILGNYEQAKIMLTEAISEFQTIGNQLGAAWCLRSIGNISKMLGNLRQAKMTFAEAKSLFQVLQNQLGGAWCLHDEANIERLMGNYEPAKIMLLEAKSQFEAISNQSGPAWCLKTLGDIAIASNNYKEAENLLNAANAQLQSAGDQSGVACCLLSLSGIRKKLGQYEHAKSMITQARSLFQNVEDQFRLAESLKMLGEIELLLKNYNDANIILAEAMSQFEAIGNKDEVAECQGHLNDIAKTQKVTNWVDNSM